jgi:hypothetical protein
MFCSHCGRALVVGVRFCNGCGASTDTGVSPVAGAPTNYQAAIPLTSTTAYGQPIRAMPYREPISTMTAVVIAVGILMGIGCIAGIGGLLVGSSVGGTVDAVIVLDCLILFGTCVWAGVDASRIRMRDYKTPFDYPFVVFIGTFLLWIVVFPWYLMVRSRILAGRVEKRDWSKPYVGIY